VRQEYSAHREQHLAARSSYAIRGNEPCFFQMFRIILSQALSCQTAKHPSESARGLVEQFKSPTIFWKQFEVAKKIVALDDMSVLQDLEPWLSNEDMLLRGNGAFIFASLGNDRGFQVLKGILEDRCTKRAVFEIDSTGSPSLRLQIRDDRYYAAHLTGGATTTKTKSNVINVSFILHLLLSKALSGFAGVIASFSSCQRNALLRLFQAMFNYWNHSLLFRK
jgi:hypothetical protein